MTRRMRNRQHQSLDLLWLNPDSNDDNDDDDDILTYVALALAGVAIVIAIIACIIAAAVSRRSQPSAGQKPV